MGQSSVDGTICKMDFMWPRWRPDGEVLVDSFHLLKAERMSSCEMFGSSILLHWVVML